VAAEGERNGLATVSAGGRLEIIGPDGLRLHVDERPPLAAPPGADPALSTLPLWYTPDVAGAAGVLSRLGLTPRGDVRPLAARLTGRGLTASVVDENYGLTLRVPDPDGAGDIYVNQVQTDLHGYRRAGT
jgi:hypothetical protein